MTNSRNLSDTDALALLARTGGHWGVSFFPAAWRRRELEPAWFAVNLSIDTADADGDRDTLYFDGYAPTLGRAALKALIKATRWARTGRYR